MMAEDEIVEVRALPDRVVDRATHHAGGSNGELSLTERIGRDRHDRHISAWNKLHADLAAVREEVDERIMEHSQRARQKILESDEEARELLAQLQDDRALRTMSWQQVVMCRTMITEHLQGCNSIIDTLYNTLMEIEAQRVEKLRGVLRDAHRLIVSIAHVLPSEADRMVYAEAEEINRTMLDNYVAYADVKAQLLADRVNMEEHMDVQWEILSERWKHFKEQDLTQQCLDTILDLTAYDEQRCLRLDQFNRDLHDLMQTRIELMKSAAHLSPAFAAASEYDARLQAWQADMRNIHNTYAQMHHTLRSDLQRLLQEKQDECNAAVTSCLRSLVDENVCSPERARLLVDRECRHACVVVLRDSHKETEAFVQALDDVSATLHAEADALTEICRSLYEQWTECGQMVAQQEDAVVEKIHGLRSLLRQRQAETEQALDMKIDALRQAGSKDALAGLKRAVETHLTQAKKLLEEYGDSAKGVPTTHPTKIKAQAEAYFERVEAILGVVRLSEKAADREADPRHIVRAHGRDFRMKRRRWAPTLIGVRNHAPVSSSQSRTSSRGSTRTRASEVQGGEKRAVFLSTLPKLRRVVSRVDSTVAVDEAEVAKERRERGLQPPGNRRSTGRNSTNSVAVVGELGSLTVTPRRRSRVRASAQTMMTTVSEVTNGGNSRVRHTADATASEAGGSHAGRGSDTQRTAANVVVVEDHDDDDDDDGDGDGEDNSGGHVRGSDGEEVQPAGRGVGGGVRAHAAPQMVLATAASPSPAEEQSDKNEYDSDDFEDDDDDDNLKPYASAKRVEEKLPWKPRYLRDAFDGISDKKDYKKVAASLAELPRLIEQAPGELNELAVPALRRLLIADNEFQLPDFEQNRTQALIGVVYHCPHASAAFLIEQFYTTELSLGHRRLILNTLVLGAVRLSGRNPTAQDTTASLGVHDASTATAPKADEKDEREMTADEIVQQRLEKKTRRFHPSFFDKTRRQPSSQHNRFHDVAGEFFFPLIAKYDQPIRTMRMLEQDMFMLSLLLRALGTCMYCAAFAPIFPRMAMTFCEFALSLLYITDADMHQALLSALLMMVECAPAHLLLTDLRPFLTELRCWIEEVMESSPAPECRRLAASILVILHERTTQQRQERTPM